MLRHRTTSSASGALHSNSSVPKGFGIAPARSTDRLSAAARAKASRAGPLRSDACVHALTEYTKSSPLTLARALYWQRRMRARFFPGSLFAEPTWDMLLDLFIADCERRKITVKSVCIAADVPVTTALRQLRYLTEQGLIERLDNPRDARSSHVRLSEAGCVAMTEYLRAMAADCTPARFASTLISG